MGAEEKSIENSVRRMIFVGISVLLQIFWLVMMAVKLNEFSVYISLGTSVLALILVLKLYNRRSPMGYKLLWII